MFLAKRLFYTVFLLSVITSVFYATAQYPEVIKYNDSVTALHTEPLADYIASHEEVNTLLRSAISSSALWRMYVGTWEIIEDKLYLVDLRLMAPSYSSENSALLSLPFEDFFPPEYIDEEGRVFCFWFTGRLSIPGSIHERGSFGNVFTDYTLISVVQGKVTGQRKSKKNVSLAYTENVY